MNRPAPLAGTSKLFERLRDFSLTFFIIFTATSGLSRLHSIGADASQIGFRSNDGSLVNQVVLVGIFMAAALSAFGMHISLKRLWQCAWPVLPLGIVVLASLAWSDVPDIAMRRSMRLFIEFITTVLFVATFRHPSHFFSIATRAFAIVLLADMVVLAFPEFSFTKLGFRGIHSHKNEAGTFALLALPFFLLTIRNIGAPKKAAISIALVIGTLVVLGLSQSKTSGAAAIFCLALSGLIVFMLCFRNYTKRAAFSFAVAAVMVGWFLLALFGVTPIDLVGIMWDNQTLTGRDQVWRFTSEVINQSPLLGVGFGSFWGAPLTAINELFASGITFPYSQTHNGYLDVLVQIGWLGMACVGFWGVVVAIRLFSLSPWVYDRKHILVCSYLLMVFWLHNITESSIIRPSTLMWVFFLFASHAILTLFANKEAAVTVDGARSRKLISLP